MFVLKEVEPVFLPPYNWLDSIFEDTTRKSKIVLKESLDCSSVNLEALAKNIRI